MIIKVEFQKPQVNYPLLIQEEIKDYTTESPAENHFIINPRKTVAKLLSSATVLLSKKKTKCQPDSF